MSSSPQVQNQKVCIQTMKIANKLSFLRSFQGRKPRNLTIASYKADIVIFCWLNNILERSFIRQICTDTVSFYIMAKSQMKIRSTKIKVGKHNFFTCLSKSYGKICRKQAFSNSAFSAGNRNNLHIFSIP